MAGLEPWLWDAPVTPQLQHALDYRYRLKQELGSKGLGSNQEGFSIGGRALGLCDLDVMFAF